MPAQPLTTEQLEDAKRLRAIFEDRKQRPRSDGFPKNQDELAYRCGWSSQSTVSQYLKGDIPLNLKAALLFSRELKCEISDFSVHLAGLLLASGTESETRNAVGSANTRPSILTGPALMPEELAILNFFRQAGMEGKEIMLRLVGYGSVIEAIEGPDQPQLGGESARNGMQIGPKTLDSNLKNRARPLKPKKLSKLTKVIV